MADQGKAQRFKRLEHLFHSAKMMDGMARASYLDRVCGSDDALRREVEALLAAQPLADDFLSIPATDLEARRRARDLAQQSFENKLSVKAESLIGRAINQYEIVKLLGVGGMGEVWLAEDTHLKRKVALKLLPGEFRSDADRVRRFEQEARAVLALNHPNIITMFDFGHAEEGYFITTEFVDGQTLRERLRESAPLPAREAIEVALQLCSALAAAHEAGIVHRDIKPENVMLRRDGFVKVLDFGLAKLIEVQGNGETERENTLSQTNPGVVMGTVSYMSPEQARGQKVDARSDIFSLGVVLFELLAGRLPFEGEALSDRLASLLRDDPPSLAQLSAGLPVALDQIVQKALAKRREDRWASAEAFADALRGMLQELEFESRFTHRELATPSATHRIGTRALSLKTIRSPQKNSWWLALSLLVIAGAILLWFKWPRQPQVTPLVMDEFAPVRLTHHIALDRQPYYSPDGKRIAFDSNRDGLTAVYVMNADGSEVRKLVNDLDCHVLDWSSDGTKILLWANSSTYEVRADGSGLTKLPNPFGKLSPDGKKIVMDKQLVSGSESSTEIFVANADGSHPVRLTNNRSLDTSAHWSPDGRRIVFTCFPDGFVESGGNNAEICVMNADGSNLLRLTNHSPNDSNPSWSPDGTRIAFASMRNCKMGSAMQVMNADGSNPMQLTECQNFDGSSWSPDGKRIVFASDRDGNYELYSINADPSHQTNLTRHPAEDREPVWSRDGKKIAFVSNRDGQDSLFVMDAGGGQQRKLVNNVGSRLSWSPDGKRIAFGAAWDGKVGIYIANADGGSITPLTRGQANENHPVWSPDGQRILYVASHDDLSQLYVMNADGSGATRISHSAEHEWQHDWSPDGRQIIFTRSRRRGVQQDIWMMNADGGNPRLIAAAPGNDEFLYPRFSPDGRRIAYHRRVASPLQADVWVMNADGSEQTRLTHLSGGWPAWSPEGRRIAFHTGKRAGNSEIYVMDVASR